MAFYPQLMETKKFISQFTNASKTFLETKKNKDQVSNLLRNYKNYHKLYNQESAALGAVSYWCKKINWEDKELWNIIKRSSPRFPSNTSAANFNYEIPNEIKAGRNNQNYINNRPNKFSPQVSSSIANDPCSRKIFRNSDLINNFVINNENDLLYFLKITNGKTELEFTEDKLIEILPRIENIQVFYDILHEFSLKNHYLLLSSIRNIEGTILAQKQLNLNNMHLILQTINHKTFFWKISQEFWNRFEEMVERNMSEWPVALTMSYIASAGFHSSKLFSILIPQWKEKTLNSQNPETFRQGFTAVALTPFMNEELLNWSKSQILSLYKRFSCFDLAHVMRSLTLINNYDPEIWGLLVPWVAYAKFSKLNHQEKCILGHIMNAIDIDRPEAYLEYLTALKPFQSELLASQKKKRHFSKSIVQEKLGEILRSLEITYLESQVIANTYEADFLLPVDGIIIELMGWPYHLSQYTQQINKKTAMKIRHLKTLKWKIVLVASFENIESRLYNVIKMLRNSRHILCVQINRDNNSFI